jgi:two-component system, OmpR family, copper resistance phosphate regulon response regulator CusR
MKILIIEDESSIANFIKASLESQLYIVDIACDGDTGALLARTGKYDLIILDYMLPGKNGLEIIKEIRRDKKIPIIMLTIYGEFDCKEQAFNLGVDDFLTKPFLLEELFLRLKALLRRSPNIKPNVLRVDNLVMDMSRQLVKRRGKNINLTRKEYCILEYLMCHRGEIKSRESIMEGVWDINSDPFSNTLDTHILNLRQKLKNNDSKELIHTFPGRGYKLDSKKF